MFILDLQAEIIKIAQDAIEQGHTPHVSVIAGQGEEILVQVVENSEANSEDVKNPRGTEIFDLASLTKPLATATAASQLIAAGAMGVQDPVSRFIPEFNRSDKQGISLHHLLTHTSGLPAYRNYQNYYGDTVPASERRRKIEEDLAQISLEAPVGSHFEYSCLSFILLASVVEKVAGMSLDQWCGKNIYAPAAMKDTCFCPPEYLHARCMPTEIISGQALRGVVHDETARFLNGVGGNAGLFATALDVAIFARHVLNWRNSIVFGEAWERANLSPFVPRTELPNGVRSYGWDMDTAYTPQVKGEAFKIGGIGHSGFTGTSIWLDPVSNSYVIILTNRVNYGRSADISGLRCKIATLVGRHRRS